MRHHFSYNKLQRIKDCSFGAGVVAQVVVATMGPHPSTTITFLKSGGIAITLEG
jgi:hypothetical protein